MQAGSSVWEAASLVQASPRSEVCVRRPCVEMAAYFFVFVFLV